MSSCQADGWSSKGLPSQPQQQLWLADSGCQSCGGVHLKGLGDIKFEGCGRAFLWHTLWDGADLDLHRAQVTAGADGGIGVPAQGCGKDALHL